MQLFTELVSNETLAKLDRGYSVMRAEGEIPGTLLITRTLIKTVLVVLGLRETCDHGGSGFGTTLYVIPRAVYAFVDFSVI